MILSVAAAMVSAFVVAMAAAWWLARNAFRVGLIDAPTARGSHQVPTPRAGGIGIAAGVAVGLAILTISRTPVSSGLAVLAICGGALGIVGVLDDRYSIRVRYRLIAQIGIAAATAIALGSFTRLPLPPPLDLDLAFLSVPLTILWIVVVVNFFNFLDGLDGLAGGQAVASCIGIAIAAWSVSSVELSAILSLAIFGFLVFNLPPARIFLGDGGSTTLGYAIATMPLLAPWDQRSSAVLAVAIGLSLFLLDPLETLVRLRRTAHPLGVSHRLHSYQILSPTTEAARVVVALITGCGLILSIAGALAFRNEVLAWPSAALGVTAFAVEKYLASHSGRPASTPVRRS